MTRYAGIDLHSTNSVVVVSDEEDKVLAKKRLPNRLDRILEFLEPHREELAGVVVESTYNWYWLVDGLRDHCHDVHLANTVAIQQYNGLKHRDDESDARWLATLLRLGQLPEGYIYPREQRALRDLLRKRSRMVRQKTSNLLSFQGAIARQLGKSISGNDVKKVEPQDIDRLFKDANVALSLKCTLMLINYLGTLIETIESSIDEQVKLRDPYKRLLSVPGIGKTLAATIMLETGDIERFGGVGNYVSYCRLVDSSHWSNGKRKGAGNTKNGNAYLCWAYVEAANFAIRYNKIIRRYFDRKKARSKRVVALKAVAHKLGRACYHMINENVKFDIARAFMQ